MSESAIEAIREGNLVAYIYAGGEAENPRDWRYEASTLACYHKRYQLGDWQKRLDMEDTQAICAKSTTVSLPVFMMDHSGLTISSQPFRGEIARWDSGQLGRIYMEQEAWQREYGWKRLTQARREKIEQRLQAELDEWGGYVSGDSYYIELWYEGKIDEDYDHIDTTGGIIGLTNARAYAHDMVKGLV